MVTVYEHWHWMNIHRSEVRIDSEFLSEWLLLQNVCLAAQLALTLSPLFRDSLSTNKNEVMCQQNT